jgi:hypothetical protein
MRAPALRRTTGHVDAREPRASWRRSSLSFEEEADESALWLEVIDAVRSEPKIRAEARLLRAEAVEFRSIFSKARATTRRRLKTHGNEDLPESGSQ